MTKKANFNISKLLASNWVITLSATLIGVFLALYLNEIVASNKLNNQKAIATKNILSEISSNQEKIEKSIDDQTGLLEILIFFVKYKNDENEVIAPVDSMNAFKNKYPKVITIEDSILQSNGHFKYTGETYIDVSLPHINITTIAWKTLKSSGFSSTYGFDCLMYLEKIDNLTNEILQNDEILFEFLNGTRDSGPKNEVLIKHITFLKAYENMLNELYKTSESKLSNCD